jgi:hypothetical protein
MARQVKKKRVGRPSAGLDRQFTLFVTATMYRRVEKYAEIHKLTFSEAARRLIALGWNAATKKPDAEG